MPLKRKSKKFGPFKRKTINIKTPKGFFLDDPDSDVIGFRDPKTGKSKVGVVFTKVKRLKGVPRPPKRFRKGRKK